MASSSTSSSSSSNFNIGSVANSLSNMFKSIPEQASKLTKGITSTPAQSSYVPSSTSLPSVPSAPRTLGGKHINRKKHKSRKSKKNKSKSKKNKSTRNRKSRSRKYKK